MMLGISMIRFSRGSRYKELVQQGIKFNNEKSTYGKKNQEFITFIKVL